MKKTAFFIFFVLLIILSLIKNENAFSGGVMGYYNSWSECLNICNKIETNELGTFVHLCSYSLVYDPNKIVCLKTQALDLKKCKLTTFDVASCGATEGIKITSNVYSIENDNSCVNYFADHTKSYNLTNCSPINLASITPISPPKICCKPTDCLAGYMCNIDDDELEHQCAKDNSKPFNCVSQITPTLTPTVGAGITFTNDSFNTWSECMEATDKCNILDTTSKSVRMCAFPNDFAPNKIACIQSSTDNQALKKCTLSFYKSTPNQTPLNCSTEKSDVQFNNVYTLQTTACHTSINNYNYLFTGCTDISTSGDDPGGDPGDDPGDPGDDPGDPGDDPGDPTHAPETCVPAIPANANQCVESFCSCGDSAKSNGCAEKTRLFLTCNGNTRNWQCKCDPSCGSTCCSENKYDCGDAAKHNGCPVGTRLYSKCPNNKWDWACVADTSCGTGGNPPGGNNPTVTQMPTNCDTKVKGDANCDTKIDGIDYTIWLNNQCSVSCTATNLLSDFNKDSKIDENDYTIWHRNRK